MMDIFGQEHKHKFEQKDITIFGHNLSPISNKIQTPFSAKGLCPGDRGTLYK